MSVVWRWWGEKIGCCAEGEEADVVWACGEER